MAERESKERRDKILLDAELHRAQLLKPGKFNLNHLIYDANHKSLGSHVDDAMVAHIISGDFIELKDLVPKSRPFHFRASQPEMKLINVKGKQRWVEEEDTQVLSSYKKWEEAFEIYASIYVRGHPHHADELYDYKYSIRDAAATYVWENVFDYDVEFRLHMARCKHNRSWSARLDCEYNRLLKNHISFRHDKNGNDHLGGAREAKPSEARDICHRYNKGRCTWGNQCRYLHKCSKCGKMGHGAVICRSSGSKTQSDVEPKAEPSLHKL